MPNAKDASLELLPLQDSSGYLTISATTHKSSSTII